MTTTNDASIVIDSALLERAMNEQLQHASALAADGPGSDDTTDYLIASLNLASDLVDMWRDDDVERFRALLEDEAPDHGALDDDDWGPPRGIDMYACDGVCELLQRWFT